MVKESDFTKEELIEFRKMKQAFQRGHDLTSNAEHSIRNLGLRHSIEEIERQADLTRKHKNSAEVVLSFLAGITVGSFKAAHKFIFPSLPDKIDVPPEVLRKKRR